MARDRDVLSRLARLERQASTDDETHAMVRELHLRALGQDPGELSPQAALALVVILGLVGYATYSIVKLCN